MVFFHVGPATGGEAATQPRAYHSDPHHLWNRLHETLFVRTSTDGMRFGHDRLDPLLWANTRYPLVDRHAEVLRVLDEFIASNGEKLVSDPLQRAFLQHDLWTMFDWSTIVDPHGARGRATPELQNRLAIVIRRLALSDAEIAALPNNYVGAAASVGADLPRDLWKPESGWVNLGLESGTAVAPIHLGDFGGRSVFNVVVRLPDGRAATLQYLERLSSFEPPWISPPPAANAASSPSRDQLIPNPALPQFPLGTRWALVRRMCVIDTKGNVRPTRFVESIQIRRYDVIDPTRTFVGGNEAAQKTFEYVASRARAGALRRVGDDEVDFTSVQFRSMGVDLFEFPAQDSATAPRNDGRHRGLRPVLQSSRTCHSASGIHSVQTYSRIFGPHTLRPPQLLEAGREIEEQQTVQWKQRQYDFGLLQGLWRRTD